MKKRLAVFIDGEIIRVARERAAEEGRSLDRLIRDALVWYLANKGPFQKGREHADQLFCGRPMRLGRRQFREIINADAFE